MSERPRIKVRWIKGRRIRITATRGAVTTEATLTEAEANQLAHQLARALNGSHGPLDASQLASPQNAP